MNKHLKQLIEWQIQNNIDVVYINDPINIKYFTNFYCEPEERIFALFTFKNKDPFIFAPELELDEIKNGTWEYESYGYLDHQDPFKIIAEKIKNKNITIKTFAIEKNSLSVKLYESIKKEFPSADFSKDVTKFIQKERLIKSLDEIKLMKEAGKEADYAFKIGFESIRNNYSEQDIVAEIQYKLMKKGIMKMSFDTIVQAGKDAADPHGEPKKNSYISKNELVLFDLGTVHEGYVSDATRTVAYGNPNKKLIDMYNVCLEAQETAQESVKPGIKAYELDKIARDIIKKHNYGKYFIHRLGHGIGMSVHEFPSIMEGNDLIIQPGMCFSIEPGIYIPGIGGVRIEDCVYVTENGCQPFTHTPKELTYIN